MAIAAADKLTATAADLKQFGFSFLRPLSHEEKIAIHVEIMLCLVEALEKKKKKKKKKGAGDDHLLLPDGWKMEQARCPVETAVKMSEDGGKMLRGLLKKGLDPKKSYVEGMTILEFAKKEGTREAVEILEEAIQPIPSEAIPLAATRPPSRRQPCRAGTA
ncbi:hypothetical protein QBC44DRAFT_375476 [Cladorrhinum sp. PSN332]|nr:hypothetical protein QBC44DRAFT_375476 [Cladorrhinum sp. PSN332]